MNSMTFKKDLIGVQNDLLRFAYKLTSDREEANDLLQETSLKALDNEDKYMPDTNFKGWIYTIMRNIFINNYQSSARPDICGPDGQSLPPEPAARHSIREHRKRIRPERDAPYRQFTATRIQSTVLHACFRF